MTAPLIEDEQYDHEMLDPHEDVDEHDHGFWDTHNSEAYDDRLDYEGWHERFDDDPNPYHGDYSEM